MLDPGGVVTSWMTSWTVLVAQGATTPTTSITDVLLGLGLPGVVVLALGRTVHVLYKRVDEDRAYHRDRADKLAEEVRALNATIRDDYIRGLAAATEAISDFLKANQQPRGR